jgi:hypothetical protein
VLHYEFLVLSTFLLCALFLLGKQIAPSFDHRLENRCDQLAHHPLVYAATFACGYIVPTARCYPNMEPPYLGVPFAYELNRKAFRLKRSQFGDATLNNSLRPCQSVVHELLLKVHPAERSSSGATARAVRVSPQIGIPIPKTDSRRIAPVLHLAIVLVSIALLRGYKEAWERFFVRLSR